MPANGWRNMTLRNAAKSASSNTMKVWIAVLSVVLALLIAGFCVRKEYRQNILPQWIHHTAETAPDADGNHTTTVVMFDGELAWQYDVGYGSFFHGWSKPALMCAPGRWCPAAPCGQRRQGILRTFFCDGDCRAGVVHDSADWRL